MVKTKSHQTPEELFILKEVSLKRGKNGKGNLKVTMEGKISRQAPLLG